MSECPPEADRSELETASAIRAMGRVLGFLAESGETGT